MKTIEEWLQELPEPAKSRALNNMWWEDAHTRQPSLALALRQAFNWSRTTEGIEYWHDVHAAIINGEKIPA